jgi:hypothetical protein
MPLTPTSNVEATKSSFSARHTFYNFVSAVCTAKSSVVGWVRLSLARSRGCPARTSDGSCSLALILLAKARCCTGGCLHVAWVCAPPARWGYTPSQLTVSSQDPVWEGRPDDPDRGFRCPDCEVHEAHAKYLGTRDLAASFAHRVTFYRRMLGGRTSYGRTGDITSPDLRA